MKYRIKPYRDILRIGRQGEYYVVVEMKKCQGIIIDSDECGDIIHHDGFGWSKKWLDPIPDTTVGDIDE